MSNNPVRLPWMQRILTSKQKKAVAEATSAAKTEKPIEEVKRYFNLEVYPDEAIGINPVKVLEAGQLYRIIIQCDRDSIDEKQRVATISGSFDLHVECHAEKGICPFSLPYEQQKLHFESPFDTIEIPFIVPQDDCPSGVITITIKYIEHGRTIGRSVTQCPFMLQGNCTPEDPQWLEGCGIAAEVPKNTVVLSVEPAQEVPGKTSKECLLTAWNYHYTMFSRYIDVSSYVNIAEAIKKKINPVEIVRRLSVFSHDTIGNFMRWVKEVKEVVEKRGEQLSMVIFDTTAFEIAWEMLEMPKHQYLGAEVQIARWLPLEDFGKMRLLKIEQAVCKGSVISYLDQYVSGTLKERKLLRQFRQDEMASLELLQARLEESLEAVGLLYIACHGSNGRHLYSSSSTQSSNNFEASWLLDLVSSAGPRPTLFINACESARIIYKNDSYAYHLVKNFLLRCAGNYIGTLTNVSSWMAPEIANRILELAKENEGVQIVEILRCLRSETIAEKNSEYQQFKGKEETEEKRKWKEQSAEKFLNIFSYVYYGNPLARLHLHPAQDSTEGEA